MRFHDVLGASGVGIEGAEGVVYFRMGGGIGVETDVDMLTFGHNPDGTQAEVNIRLHLRNGKVNISIVLHKRTKVLPPQGVAIR
jgi:hypothetical protein